MDPITRYELIRPILTGEKTVEQVETEASVSLRTLYRYLRRFREGESLADQSHAASSHPKWLTDEDKATVIRYKLENPSLSHRRLAQQLKEQGILEISYRSVANILTEGHFPEHFFFRH